MVSQSTEGLRLHGRQFVIGPRRFAPMEDWRQTQLSASLVLSHCPLLHIREEHDADGRKWALLGRAVQCDATRPDPMDEVALTSSDRVPYLCESWTGRWALAGSAMYLDAAGLMGCFYGRNHDGEVWASSSPALLASLLFREIAPRVDNRHLRYEIGLYWFVPPHSRFEGMLRLLPSQALDLVEGVVHSRPFMTTIVPDKQLEQVYAELTACLTTVVRRAAFEQPVWLALSAGADSRLILAIAHSAGIQFKSYTRLAARTKLADRLLPPRLAAQVGRDHVYFRGRTWSSIPGRRELVAAQGAGHVAIEDVLPLLDGSRDSMRGTTIGGNCFGVGKSWGRNGLPRDVGDIDAALPAIARGLGEPLTSTGMKSVREWLLWCRDTPAPNMDWRDRCYIELRLAGWLSSKEQIYDVTPLDRFVPVNSMRAYSLLLSVPEALRPRADHQAAMISALVPELMREPFNPPDSYFGTIPSIASKARFPLEMVRKGRQKFWRGWNAIQLMTGR